MWAGRAAALSPTRACCNSFIFTPNDDSQSRMYLLVLFQHGYELGYLSRACLRSLYRLYAEENGIPVSAFQGGKECLCPRTLVKRGLKIVRHSRVARGVIRLFPPPILFSTQHFFEPPVSHPPAFDQGGGFLPIDLRPDASLAARCKSLQPRVGALRLLVRVDPSKTERRFQCLSVGQRANLRSFFRDPQPHTGGLAMIPRQPVLPRLLVLKIENGRLFVRNGFDLHANQLTYLRLLIESSYTPPVKGVSSWRYS